jgi:hypothetical protein
VEAVFLAHALNMRGLEKRSKVEDQREQLIGSRRTMAKIAEIASNYHQKKAK